jgi:hypothetical protein
VRTLFFIRKKIIEATFTRFVEARKKGAWTSELTRASKKNISLYLFLSSFYFCLCPGFLSSTCENVLVFLQFWFRSNAAEKWK